MIDAHALGPIRCQANSNHQTDAAKITLKYIINADTAL